MTAEVQTLTLNEDQENASKGVFEFLMGNQKEMIISGPGGVGKTFLMGHIIDNIIPQYQSICQMMNIPSKYDSIIMTATTNKAAEVLSRATGRPTKTIHSFMNLTVVDDYASGRSKLTKTRGWEVHEDTIIFIDECSMIDTPLRTALMEGTKNCKIIYVGDHCQLAPVMEAVSPIYTQNLVQHTLLQQMRNNGQPALMAVCNQLRHTVETGEFKPIKIQPGVIDLFTADQMEEILTETFHEENGACRVLAYTNKRVTEYNDYIRQDIRSRPEAFQLDETLVNNSAVQLKAAMLSVEAEVKIVWADDKTKMVDIDDGVQLEVRDVILEDQFRTCYTVMLPMDRQHFTDLVKYYKKIKNWNRYFHLKNTYPDLRPRDSSTVHKAQGSTYETAFIDLDDLSTCTNPNMAARMLYVAFSRARNRVIMYGNLAERFGGLIA